MTEQTQSSAFAEHDHDHNTCQGDALVRAEMICAERGVRLTDIRRRVLEHVWGGHKPLGAYEILALLRVEQEKTAPPTVYRALDFLLEHGLIHRIESLNAFVGCTEPETPHPAQFLICGQCGATAELNDPRIDKAINEQATAAGFSVNRRTIEVEGTCPHCLHQTA